jgi:hypothetical protein
MASTAFLNLSFTFDIFSRFSVVNSGFGCSGKSSPLYTYSQIQCIAIAFVKALCIALFISN